MTGIFSSEVRSCSEEVLAAAAVGGSGLLSLVPAVGAGAAAAAELPLGLVFSVVEGSVGLVVGGETTGAGMGLVVRVERGGDDLHVPAAALASSAAPSVFGGGRGLSCSAEMAETGSELELSCGVEEFGSAGETGETSSALLGGCSFPALALPGLLVSATRAVGGRTGAAEGACCSDLGGTWGLSAGCCCCCSSCF